MSIDTGSSAPIAAEVPETELPPVAEVKAEEPAKADPLGPKFVALSRKEREIREKSKALTTKEAELQKRLQDMEARSKSEKTLAEKFKENPLAALQEIGLTYDQLSEIVLNDGNPTMDMKLERRAKELESKTLSEIEQLKKQIAEKEEKEAQERYNQTINNFKMQIRNEVSGNEDKYELIKAHEAYDLVMEVMQEFYNTNETLMDLNQALEAVEAHLEDEARQILKLKKFQTSSTPKQPTEGKQAAPTLSNTLAADVPQNGRHNLSEEELFAEAARKIVFR